MSRAMSFEVKRARQYIGVDKVEVTEAGRYNDLASTMTVWSVQSGDQIPEQCKIPDLVVPTELPLSLTIDNPRVSPEWEVFGIDQITRWAEAVSYQLSGVDVVMSRGPMRSICGTPNKCTEKWNFCLYKYRDTLFLDWVSSEDPPCASVEPSTNKFAAWAKIYEDVMQTGGKRTPGYSCEDVDVRVPRLIKLGSLNILSNCKISCQFPGQNKDQLKNYVEVKTAAVLTTEKQVNQFNRHKSRDIWAHCAPVGIETVYIGWRTSTGELEEIKKYTMADLARAGTGWWSPGTMLSFLHELLKWARANTSEGMSYTLAYNGTGQVILDPAEHSEFERVVKANFPEE